MFRRLLRHFGRGLIDNDLITPGADLGPSMAALLSAFVVLSAGVALTFLSKYNSVAYKPRPGFIPAQFQTLAEKLAMARDDKALLIGAAMIVMGLIVVVCWDALVLDDRDVAVLGPLPVRPSTMLTAKAGAAAAAAAAAAVALNVLPALLFPVVVLLKTTLGPLDVLREMVAQGIAGVAACTLVFLAFASLRTLAALFRRDGLVARLLPVVQFTLVFVLLASLFALPDLAGRTRAAVDAGAGRILRLPWVWFVGLGEVVAGRHTGVFIDLSRTALTALAVCAIAAVVLQLLLFRLRFHRAGARALSPRSRIARAIAWTAALAGSWLIRDGRARAMFFFS